MRLVDTRTHAWGPDTAELPWYGSDLPPGWSGPYPHEDLVANMDANDVDEGLLLPTTIHGRHRRANEHTLRAIEAHPERLWGVGVAEYRTDEQDLRENVRRVLGSVSPCRKKPSTSRHGTSPLSPTGPSIGSGILRSDG